MVFPCSLFEPIGGLLQILRARPSLHIGLSEIIGCERMPLLGRGLEKIGGFLLVLLHAAPLGQHQAKLELRVLVTGHGAFGEPLHGLCIVLTDAGAFRVKPSKQRSGLDVPLRRALGCKLERLLIPAGVVGGVGRIVDARRGFRRGPAAALGRGSGGGRFLRRVRIQSAGNRRAGGKCNRQKESRPDHACPLSLETLTFGFASRTLLQK